MDVSRAYRDHTIYFFDKKRHFIKTADKIFYHIGKGQSAADRKPREVNSGGDYAHIRLRAYDSTQSSYHLIGEMLIRILSGSVVNPHPEGRP